MKNKKIIFWGNFFFFLRKTTKCRIFYSIPILIKTKKSIFFFFLFFINSINDALSSHEIELFYSSDNKQIFVSLNVLFLVLVISIFFFRLLFHIVIMPIFVVNHWNGTGVIEKKIEINVQKKKQFVSTMMPKMVRKKIALDMKQRQNEKKTMSPKKKMYNKRKKKCNKRKNRTLKH